jgi:N-acetylglucosamine-6-phosphate deacetylase
VQQIGIPLDEALRMASTYVADYLGRGDLGRIAPGACADLVMLDDDIKVIATLRDGALAHGAFP